jgi:hypothetical protein
MGPLVHELLESWNIATGWLSKTTRPPFSPLKLVSASFAGQHLILWDLVLQ